MGHLTDKLLQPGVRPKVITDCEAMVGQEVAQKGGLSGLAVKAAFSVVKRIKPGFVGQVIDKMLDSFVQELEPFYVKATAASVGFVDYLPSHAHEVADKLLRVTDGYAQRANNAVAKGAYDKLRPTGVKHVEAAVPAIAKVVVAHL